MRDGLDTNVTGESNEAQHRNIGDAQQFDFNGNLKIEANEVRQSILLLCGEEITDEEA